MYSEIGLKIKHLFTNHFKAKRALGRGRDIKQLTILGENNTYTRTTDNRDSYRVPSHHFHNHLLETYKAILSYHYNFPDDEVYP